MLDKGSGVNAGHGEDELEMTAAGPESAVNLIELEQPIRKSVGVQIG